MSSIIHYIDTSVPDISQARVISLTNRVPQAFPVLAYGDNRQHEFIFHYAGTVEAFSGANNYTLRATLGNANLGPASGTFTLTCGTTTPALDSQSDAAAIAFALNQLATVVTGGGVSVVGQFPSFLIAWNTEGAQTAITASAVLLVPASAITITSIQAGDSTHAQMSSLQMRQSFLSQQTNWTNTNSPANGWYGALATNTNALAPFMVAAGADDAGFFQAQTLLTVDVIDVGNSNSATTYFQAPIFIRSKNLG